MKCEIIKKITCDDCGVDHEVFKCKSEGLIYFLCKECIAKRSETRRFKKKICLDCGSERYLHYSRCRVCNEKYYAEKYTTRKRCECGNFALSGLKICYRCRKDKQRGGKKIDKFEHNENLRELVEQINKEKKHE